MGGYETEAEIAEATDVESDAAAQAFRNVTETPTPTYLDDVSALSPEQVDRLASELDQRRIRTRKGRGRGVFEYIAAHDAIRTANAIFGFGKWGSEVVTQDRLGEVPVVHADNGREGYHVAYRCVVRLTVAGCVPTSGTGYGDGVEYGGETARLTASELALKEAESDALKRALVKFGDQFGLILYAKVDEKKRIESDERAEQAGPTQVQHTARDESKDKVPRSMPELVAAFDTIGVDSTEWLREAIQTTHGLDTAWSDLDTAEKNAFGQKAAAAFLHLRDELMDGRDFPPPSRVETQAAFAFGFDGMQLGGPPWRLGPDDPDGTPTKDEYEAAQAGDDAEADREDEAARSETSG